MKKKKRKLPEWVHTPIFTALRGMFGIGLSGQPGPALDVARSMGRLYARFSPLERKRFRRASEHIAIAFPSWDEERRHEQVLKMYEHLFMLVAEAAMMARLLSEDGWPAHVRLGNMAAAVRELVGVAENEASAANRPCIMITGHTGNWELLGYAMALLGFPMHALYRPLDWKSANRWVERTRQQRGLVLVDKFGAAVELPRLLDQGAAVGFVADQNGGKRGLFVPFFDRLSSAYKTIGLLALRYEAPILCGQARRILDLRKEERASLPPGTPPPRRVHAEDGLLYEVDVVDIIRPGDWVNQPDPLFYVTARYRRAIELMIQRVPEQYLWVHRNWKSRPRHELLGRPMPAPLREKIESLPWMTPEKMSRVMEWTERDTKALAAGSSVKPP